MARVLCVLRRCSKLSASRDAWICKLTLQRSAELKVHSSSAKQMSDNSNEYHRRILEGDLSGRGENFAEKTKPWSSKSCRSKFFGSWIGRRDPSESNEEHFCQLCCLNCLRERIPGASRAVLQNNARTDKGFNLRPVRLSNNLEGFELPINSKEKRNRRQVRRKNDRRDDVQRRSELCRSMYHPKHAFPRNPVPYPNRPNSSTWAVQRQAWMSCYPTHARKISAPLNRWASYPANYWSFWRFDPSLVRKLRDHAHLAARPWSRENQNNWQDHRWHR